MKKIGNYKFLLLMMFGAVLMSIYILPDVSLTSKGASHFEKIALAKGENVVKDDEYPPIVIPNRMDSTNWQFEESIDSILYLDDNIPPHIFIPLLNI